MAGVIENLAASNRKSAIGNRQCLAWQGWLLSVPADWNFVKLEGNRFKGFVLLADLTSARLGLRWEAVSSKVDAKSLIHSAMLNEVGELATKEARSHEAPRLAAGESEGPYGLLYQDSEPPGRDVWIGYSAASKRLIQLSYHATTRDRVLANDIIPTLEDQEDAQAQRWSVFDLSCETPSEFSLASHQMNAGDLRLSFTASKRREISIRQIGPAKLALSRQPLEKWLQTQLSSRQKLYRANELEKTTVELRGQPVEALRVVQTRRRRAFLHRSLPLELFTYALHDETRNRLVIIQTSDDAFTKRLFAGIGWACSNVLENIGVGRKAAR